MIFFAKGVSGSVKNLKKLTILHSNDLHGDFMAKETDHTLLGGVSMLSGYINKVRREEPNALYVISGDMFRGSLIDSEYKGISTIEIMNMLAPDVVTLGNHEVDYGVAHLLFIEKCALFPIINANMYITSNHVRLFKPYIILDVDGMKILFIGILTKDVLAQTKQEELIGSFIDVKEAAHEVGKICDYYRTEDIDFTVLLTHIGFERDKELASILDPRWGVDIIIGGHSHTLLDEPATVAGIPIVQAASGTAQIGRFDIIIDTDKNAIDSYTWNLISINEENCPRDIQLEEVILKYKDQTDKKYTRVLTRLMDRYTHNVRNQESMIGRLLSDAFQDILDIDIMFLGSGSIRAKELGPLLRYEDLAQIYPYNDEIYSINLSGKQLKQAIMYILREEVFLGLSEFYQFSRGFRVEYDRKQKKLIKLSLNGREIQDGYRIRMGLQAFHFNNIDKFLNLTMDDISAVNPPKVVCTKGLDLLEEYFSKKDIFRASDEQRIFIKEG